ncbi:hypothetical protein OROGR_000283 [Orobanche gracilis]
MATQALVSSSSILVRMCRGKFLEAGQFNIQEKFPFKSYVYSCQGERPLWFASRQSVLFG